MTLAPLRGTQKGRALLPALTSSSCPVLHPDDLDDLVGIRVDDQDLFPDTNKLISAPLRVDRHHFRRNRMELDVTRHAGADRDREVDIGDRCNVLLLNHSRDLGLLLGRELGAGAGLTRGGLAVHATLGLSTLSVGAVTILLALGLGAIAILALLRVHAVLAALFFGLANR